MGKTKQELLELGKKIGLPRNEISNATFSSRTSHLRLLLHNKGAYNELELIADTNAVLDKLVDTHGKKLNDAYKRQIGYTILTLHPNANANLQLYKTKNGNFSNNTKKNNVQYLNKIKTILTEAAKYIQKRNDVNIEIENLATYELCLLCLLTAGTTLRIHEILQLKHSNFEDIRNERPTKISSKKTGKSNGSRQIVMNDLLQYLFPIITAQKEKVSKAIFNAKKHSRSFESQGVRFEHDFIFVMSKNYLRKELKKFTLRYIVDAPQIGFNDFRRLSTTFLVDLGFYHTAKTLNNHSNHNVIANNYLITTPHGLNRTIEELLDKAGVSTEIEYEEENYDIPSSLEADDDLMQTNDIEQNNTLNNNNELL